MNKVLIAAAGSGKTRYIIDEALDKPTNEKVLLVTYTIENTEELRSRIVSRVGIVPENITIQTWFSFLLRQGVRPYQNHLYDSKRIKNVCFVNKESAPRTNQNDIERHYLSKDKHIYTDKMSKFVCKCNEKSEGLVIQRLENIYTHIFIDEVQDLAGYDLVLLELLFESLLNVTLVGDLRQVTYLTHNPRKYSQYRGMDIINFFQVLEGKDICSIEYRTECHRCNQDICDLADSLYPNMPPTTSTNEIKTGHDGIFIVSTEDVDAYMQAYAPKVLRNDKRTNTQGFPASNFGMCKGQTHDRVLIFPTNPIRKFLMTNKIDQLGSKAKPYVAITRARYSVAFVYDGNVGNTSFLEYTP